MSGYPWSDDGYHSPLQNQNGAYGPQVPYTVVGPRPTIIPSGASYGAEGNSIPTDILLDGEMDDIEVDEDGNPVELDLEKVQRKAKGIQAWLMDGDGDGVVTKAEVKTFAMGFAAGYFASRFFK